MAPSTRDRELDIHRAWMGFVQPVGLVVSPPALVKAQCVPRRDLIHVQGDLRALTRTVPVPGEQPCDDIITIDSFPDLAEVVLDWQPGDLLGADDPADLPDSLEVVLPEYSDRLAPTYAVPDPDIGADTGPDASARYLLLVRTWPRGTGLDATTGADASTRTQRWQVSPQARFERLLRETGVHAGVLFNHTHVRLVYAPRGETAGHITFPVAAMCQVAGRPILGALYMLLSAERVFDAPDGRRLTDILRASRKYQSEVSTKLAEQVLGALWELLRGFQAADRLSGHKLLPGPGGDLTRTPPDHSNHIQSGLTTTLLRLVFLLYAEDRGLMPDDDVFLQNYSIAGLYQRLRADAGQYPDTMDQRFGAWASLLSLFRLVHDGGGYAGFTLPTRHGQLFSPDAYPFLEGRPLGVVRVMGERIAPPRVSDGTVYRVLQALLILDGERLSYSGLDVEQIGSVYEAVMGFAVERAVGRALAVKSDAHKPGAVRADPVIDVDALLAEKPAQRAKWLQTQAACKLTGKAAKQLKEAQTPEDVVAALGRKVSARTPHVLPVGSLYLQPGEERRRSGSHYTPRELTGPIIATTLQPVIEALGERPTPAQILALKVCDPAMGSGAFLVETCRQLADHLVTAWQVHGQSPAGPESGEGPSENPGESTPGSDELLPRARRLVAQHCLCGVDKNPFAVNLAKLSLWLVTLARDHAFTFLDHALKCGDSLVGLTHAQIGAFHWQVEELDHGPLFQNVRAAAHAASSLRAGLRVLGDDRDGEKRAMHREAEDALDEARLTGDAVIAAFFAANKAKHRETQRQLFHREVDEWRAGGDAVAVRERVQELYDGGVRPFHWELEFPEVFERDNPGFDAMVGNPPFLGGSKISSIFGSGYLDWLLHLHERSHGNGDLVAHFLRRAFNLVRERASFGMIATNTVGQGDTRSTGLEWICTHGGQIYAATRRLKWPGIAAVVVSVVHTIRSPNASVSCMLDGRLVPRITAFLFHDGGHSTPRKLRKNEGKSFLGMKVYGGGFLFDDSDRTGRSSPLALVDELIAKDQRNESRILPYLGGAELNTNPRHLHSRYAIYFGDMTLDEVRQWPDLLAIVEERVKPERDKLKNTQCREKWWRYERTRPDMVRAIKELELERVLVIARIGNACAFTFISTKQVINDKIVVFPFRETSAFTVLQSRLHEVWARFFSSTLKDDMQYTPSDCFETFPFPADWQSDPALEAAGRAYHDYRAQLMIDNDEGLTKTYNRFHDPDEHDPRIAHLRELHQAMDRAVLAAYGWSDIATECHFLLDYDIDEATWNPRKKKPYRYRWPEPIHDEVLARLLQLNAERAAEERRTGQAGSAGRKGKEPGKKAGRKSRKTATGKRRTRTKQPAAATLNLFGSAGQDEGEA